MELSQGLAALPEGAPMQRGVFINPWKATWQEKSLSDVLQWVRERRRLKVSAKGWLEQPTLSAHPSKAEFQARFPLVPPVDGSAALPANAVQAIWVGHATVLCRMALQGGSRLSFITDPVFSKRCAPVQWAGPARVVPPAFDIEDTKALPELDFVLISHNHYDHLDSGSVHRLVKRFGTQLTWYVPLGLKAWFSEKGIQNVHELDWWQEVEHVLSGQATGKQAAPQGAAVTASSSSGGTCEVAGVRQSGCAVQAAAPAPVMAFGTASHSTPTSEVSSSSGSSRVAITMTPAQHWSARGLLDRCKSLWGGYLVQARANNGSMDKSERNPAISFWFAGDTGYCEVFKQIGDRFGPIDLSAIPIGAYEPRWFMKAQHVNPKEALQVHADVQSRRSLAIHCCTFPLSNEAMDAPPRQLLEAQAAQGLDPSQFLAIQHGEQLLVKDGQLLNTPRCICAYP